MSRHRQRWLRLRGALAGLFAAGFLAIAVAAPFTTPSTAFADEDFYQRIHQDFVPQESDLTTIHVEVSPLVKIEEPKPAAAPAPAVSTPFSPPRYTGGGSPADWMAAAGIPEKDWGYVDFVVSRESGWNPNATNSSSGACGLVQALPCSKVPGNGYDPVDNLRWADGYAKGRYGSWAGAYNFWISNNWW
ncbi:MAG: transglycosylase SLT domain-containing protein [Leucobacter sp.]|nr:transglycosylase SLT domain-containing protein [Leucobacter sp.]